MCHNRLMYYIEFIHSSRYTECWIWTVVLFHVKLEFTHSDHPPPHRIPVPSYWFSCFLTYLLHIILIGFRYPFVTETLHYRRRPYVRHSIWVYSDIASSLKSGVYKYTPCVYKKSIIIMCTS